MLANRLLFIDSLPGWKPGGLLFRRHLLANQPPMVTRKEWDRRHTTDATLTGEYRERDEVERD